MYAETTGITKANATGVKEILGMLQKVESKIAVEKRLLGSNCNGAFYRTVRADADFMKKKLSMNPCLVDAYVECINILYYSEGKEKVAEFIDAAIDKIYEMIEMMEIIDSIIYPKQSNN